MFLMKNILLDMIVEIPDELSLNDFNDMFIEWIENNKWVGGGLMKEIDDEGNDIKNKENRISLIRSCYNRLILTEAEENIVKEYKHLTYSTIDEICGESYEFNLLVKKNEYHSPTKWRPNLNSNISPDEQIYLKIIDQFEDRGELGLWRKKKNGYEKIENKANVGGYVLCKVGGVGVFTHRIIWMLSNGLLKRNEIIDHIDGDKSNNKIENLQIVTNLINGRKKPKLEKSKYQHIGVRAAQGSKTWNATINMIGCVLNLGNYKTEEGAVVVRDRAYALRLLEDPVIKNKEDRSIIRNRCRNKLTLSENDIEILKKHITGLNNKDLTVL